MELLFRSLARRCAALSLFAVRSSRSALPASAAVPAAERTALKALYSATGGAALDEPRPAGSAGGHRVLLGRRPVRHGQGTAVTGLDLSENGLAGSLPAGLGSLANLVSLDLEGNAISGPLPT